MTASDPPAGSPPPFDPPGDGVDFFGNAHTAVLTAGRPQQTHAPGTESSSGRQRIVAELSALTRASPNL